MIWIGRFDYFSDFLFYAFRDVLYLSLTLCLRQLCRQGGDQARSADYAEAVLETNSF
jgi:hypothetical protein